MIPGHWTAKLIDHLWQSTVVTVIAWLLVLALQRNQARTRYWLWMIASVKFLVPFSLFILAGEYLRSITAVHIAKPAFSAVIEKVAQPFSMTLFSTDIATTAVWPLPVAHNTALLPFLFLCVWLCGSLTVAFFWWRKWRNIRAMARAASAVALIADVPVRSSSTLLEPGVVGILRPLLLLPEGITGRLTEPQLGAILNHEMCHVRRRDNFTAAIHMMVEAMFWFHPFVWWIGMRLVEERERACDEAVLQAGSDGQVYAEGILNVCKFYIESPLACVSGVTGSDLKKRIVRIMTEQVARKLDFRRKLLLASAGVLAVAMPVMFGLVTTAQSRGQSQHTPEWQKAAGGKMEFEVATIRPNKPGAFIPPNFGLDAEDSYDSPDPHGRFSADFPLSVYIEFAYKLWLTRDQEHAMLANLPKWVATDSFVIQGMAPGDPTKDQMRLMMQSLLTDRFKLAVHFETQQTSVLALVLAKRGKTGPKLRPHAEGLSCRVHAQLQAQSSAAKIPDVFPPYCGGYMAIPGPDHTVLFGSRNTTMKLIAASLPSVGAVGRPVVDQTGLAGKYDFTLEFTPESTALSPPTAGTQRSAQGPTFLEALKEQLGLKLKPTKAPLNVLVVDHIERPSPN